MFESRIRCAQIIGALTTLTAGLSPLQSQQTIPFPPSRSFAVSDSGFAGRLYEPSSSTGTAVIVLNGSNGGYPPSRIGRSLADNGNTALLLAYFRGTDTSVDARLPARLQDIPLEYIYRAIDWLHTRTGRPVVLMGESRGAELALLIASQRADVAGVIAFAPSTATWQAPSFSRNEPVRAAWTLSGRPLPYLRDASDSGLTSVERFARTLALGAGAAAIPVEQIRGRVLLVAGDDDRIWPSGPMADSIASRAHTRSGPSVEVRRYPNAGHLLMGPGPGRERFVAGTFVVEFGGTETDNRLARDDAWARTLAFLTSLGATTGSAPESNRSPRSAAIDTAAWLADFSRIRAALSDQYPNLEWAVERRGLRLAELSRSTEAALRSATSDVVAKGVIEGFLNAFGDGHLEVRWPSGAASGASPSERDVRPLCERLGYQRARRGAGIRFELLSGFRWLASPDSAYFRAGVLVSGADRLGVLRIASFEDNIHPELCETSARTMGIATDAKCSEACEDHIRRETANQLTAALERRIQALKEQGITRLLVDVTGNGGGSNWVEAAARTLTTIPLRGSRVGFIRHPHYVRAFDADIQRLYRDSSTSRIEDQSRLGRALEVLRRQRTEASQPCDRSSLWDDRPSTCSLVVSEPSRYSTGVLAYASPADVDTTAAWRALFYPAQYRYREGMYRGPLLILVDRGTVSAAEYFAAIMMDNGAAQVVGAPTFGAGCGYTHGGIPVVLPHSRGRVRIPDCVRYRASGMNEVEGVVPEVMIPWRWNDTPLQRARRVVESLGVK